jgi:hypothetical protein
MSWNYRVVRTDQGFGVFEVYYDETGHPHGRTMRPILDFYCDTPEDLLHELELIKAACEKPPLEMRSIELGTTTPCI